MLLDSCRSKLHTNTFFKADVSQIPIEKNRIPVLDAIRGIAALSVALFHFICGEDKFLPDSMVKSVGSYGQLGVIAFFVLSGFVIPYSLHRSEYIVRVHYFRFVAKRIARLDPPYLATIVLVLLLSYLSTWSSMYNGLPFSINVPQILSHLGYLNTLLGYPWLNVVFWTLAIEFQFYLLFGLIAGPLLWTNLRYAILVLMACVFLPLLFPQPQFVLAYLGFFASGTAVFLCRNQTVRVPSMLALVLLATLSECFAVGVGEAVTGFVTTLTIAFVHRSCRPLTFLGTISYSLYLTHCPAGGRIINLSLRFAESYPAKMVWLLVATVSSITTAWVFYKFIEAPSQRWASRIRFGSERPPE